MMMPDVRIGEENMNEEDRMEKEMEDDYRTEDDYRIEGEQRKGLFETLIEMLESSDMVPDGVDGHAVAESARRMRDEPMLMRAISLGKIWTYVTQMTDMADRLRLEIVDPDLRIRKRELDDDLVRTLNRYMRLMMEQNNRLAERHVFETEDWFREGMEGRR